MNAAAINADSMSNGRHIDISTKVFTHRHEALGFERREHVLGTQFVNRAEGVVVAPVRTGCGSIDRYQTLRCMEDTLELHRAKRRGQRVITAVALIMAALFVGMVWPLVVRAEAKQTTLEHAYEAVDSSAPLATCSLPYTLGPRETTVLQCTHRLRGLAVVEKYRSGHNTVLISASATVNRGDAVLLVLHNTGDQAATGTAYAEFW